MLHCIKSLPNGRIVDWSNSKVFADNRIYGTEEIEICFGKGRKHYGNGRKCWLLQGWGLCGRVNHIPDSKILDFSVFWLKVISRSQNESIKF